ncbi:hypothetical protein [Actinomadura chokoriensis]|uniref:XRE family transcriptional regulator n=1 Tax=Actinomadura chokoriensis TaxID=454156 RepID=A0ABV4R7H5_9ACTN
MVIGAIQQSVLGWRTRRRPEVAVRYLEALAAELEVDGWRFVRLYRPASACGQSQREER